jgi:hypothetical protein
MTLAPTAEMAMGKKMKDLAIGSHRPIRSTSTAMMSPSDTTKLVTKISHSTLLRSASSMSSLVRAKT